MPDSEHDNVRTMWSEDELDTALTALRPAEDPDDRTFRLGRAELLVAAGAREPLPEPVRRRRWAWWTAAIGTVTAVAASVLVVQTVQYGGPESDAAAIEQLNLAADRVSVVDEPIGPGEYRYIATHAWWMATMDEYSYLAENVLETWVPAERHQEWLLRREVTGARKWLSGTEEEARADGHPVDGPMWPEGEWRAPCGDFYAAESGEQPCRGKGSWQQPTPEFLAGVPTGTQELYDRLRADTSGRGSDPDLEMVVYVADALRTGQVPAQVRAAMYRVLAKVPGIQITEQVANLDGRRGTAYGISAAGARHDIIVDPGTGQFIGERQIAVDGYDDIPAGTVTEYTSVTTTVVPAIGVRP
jgi:hypothetical protein